MISSVFSIIPASHLLLPSTLDQTKECPPLLNRRDAKKEKLQEGWWGGGTEREEDGGVTMQ